MAKRFLPWAGMLPSFLSYREGHGLFLPLMFPFPIYPAWYLEALSSPVDSLSLFPRDWLPPCSWICCHVCSRLPVLKLSFVPDDHLCLGPRRESSLLCVSWPSPVTASNALFTSVPHTLTPHEDLFVLWVAGETSL